MDRDEQLKQFIEGNVKCCHCNSWLNDKSITISNTIFGEEIDGNFDNNHIIRKFISIRCQICKCYSLWTIDIDINGNCNEDIEHINEDSLKLIYPLRPYYGKIPLPHQDIPKEIQDIYESAVVMYYINQNSCLTLLRLCLEKILETLNKQGPWEGICTQNTLKEKIQNIVNTNNKDDNDREWMDLDIIKAMEIIRLNGNAGTHENGCVATSEEILDLFTYINFIIEETLLRPGLTESIEQKYQSLPEQKKIKI